MRTNCARLHLVDRRRAAVAHRLAQAADELVQDAASGPLYGDAALDPLGHELLDVLDVALEVAVLREDRAPSSRRASPCRGTP